MTPELANILKSFGMDLPPAGLPLTCINKFGRPELHSESEDMVHEDLLERTAYVVLFKQGQPAIQRCACCGKEARGYIRKPGSFYAWCFGCWK